MRAASAAAFTAAQEPPHDCPLCPRLVAYRADNRKAHGDWFNAPVPSFGSGDARVLIVGLAPGVSGANRTGRPFTGDFAGELLYGTLLKSSFAKGTFQARPDDGLTLVDCRITNAVRFAVRNAIGDEARAERTIVRRLFGGGERRLGCGAHHSLSRLTGCGGTTA